MTASKRDVIEYHIVWMVLDGKAPYEDEDDYCDDDESEDFEDD